MSSYIGNPTPGRSLNQRRQQLLDMQKQIERELASIPTSNDNAGAFPVSGHPFNVQEDRSTSFYTHHGTSRRQPKAQAMSRNFTTGSSPQATSMSRSIANQPSPAMSRAKSMAASPISMSNSASTFGSSPQQYPPSTMSNTGTMDWSFSLDFQSGSQVRRQSVQKPQLEHVPELEGLGEDPAAFFSRIPSVQTAMSNSFTVSVPQQPFFSSRPIFSNQSPSTPGSLTSCTTQSSEMMSRQSTSNELASIHMLQLDSNPMLHDSVGDMYSTDIYSNGANAISSKEQNQLVADAGSFSFISQNMFDSSSLLQAEDMVRGDSNISNTSALSISSVDSTSSSTSRSKEQLRKTNFHANKRKLAPALSGDDESESRAPPLICLKSKHGLEDRMVARIPKTPYQRPKHDRVFCQHCTVEKDGFRGAHELHRHMDRAHSSLVKKWICVEPQEVKPEYTPRNPLSKCKACNKVEKRYGAYYNAAAHLRRAHFVPKTRARSKGKNGEEKEKRGGKGGGDWPPMAELKRWMVNIMEAPDSNDANDDEEVEEDPHGEFDLELTRIATNTVNQHQNAMQVPDLIFESFSTQFGSHPMIPDMSMGSMLDFTMQAFDMPRQFSDINNGMTNGMAFTTGCGQQSMAAFDPTLMGMAITDSVQFFDPAIANFDAFANMPPALATGPNDFANLGPVY